MLLVFEGPDGAGKTTLLKAVHERLRAVRLHTWRCEVYQNLPRPDVVIGWPDAHVVHAEYNALRHVDFSKQDLFKDRFWVTDEVYSIVFRRDPYNRSYVRPWSDFKGQVFVVHVTTSDWKVLAERRGITPMHPMWDFYPKIWQGMKDYFHYLYGATDRRWTPYVELCTDGHASVEELADIVTSTVLRRSE